MRRRIGRVGAKHDDKYTEKNRGKVSVKELSKNGTLTGGGRKGGTAMEKTRHIWRGADHNKFSPVLGNWEKSNVSQNKDCPYQRKCEQKSGQKNQTKEKERVMQRNRNQHQ